MTTPIQAGANYEGINVKVTFEDGTTKIITVPFIRVYHEPINGYNAIAEIRDKDFPVDVISKKSDIKTIQLEQLEKTWKVCSAREVGINAVSKGVWKTGLPPLTAYDLKEI
jgi:hypothetical protein